MSVPSVLRSLAALSLTAVRSAATSPMIPKGIFVGINGRRIQVTALGEPVYQMKWQEDKVKYNKVKGSFGINTTTLYPEDSSSVDPLLAKAGWVFAIAAFKESANLHINVKKLDARGRKALEDLVINKANKGVLFVSKEVREAIQTEYDKFSK